MWALVIGLLRVRGHGLPKHSQGPMPVQKAGQPLPKKHALNQSPGGFTGFALEVFFFFRDSLLELGAPVAPFHPVFGGGSPTKIDYTKKGTLILSSLLELFLDFLLEVVHPKRCNTFQSFLDPLTRPID